jgi:hypothetical protein
VPKRAIITPNKASKAATVANIVKDNVEESFNTHLKNTFKSIN